MHSPKVNHTKLFFFGNFFLVMEYDLITRKEKTYSLSDPLMDLSTT